MRYAPYVATFGEYADPAQLASLAADAEASGWDGFFVWDHVAMWWDPAVPVADPWVVLAAVAAATSHIRIGALVTPLARRRPWKVARETASLDRFAGGRLVLGVGLGDSLHEFECFGEAAPLAKRAEMLDEGLEVLAGLWSGQPYSHRGLHYRVEEACFLPTPLQRPRIPVWVAVSWPNPAPVRRALRWDGAIVTTADPGPCNTAPEAFASIRARAPGDRRFDLVLVTGRPDWDVERDAEEVATYAAVGVTWWLEDVDPWRFADYPAEPWPHERMRERILAGPPHFR